jgi:ubiquinone/menaquinone biosynthesis C-methylase UbiE
MTTYLFGDTYIAAQRLRLVAEAYGEATRAFVHDCGLQQPGLVVDLGCGPGYSTRLLAEVLQGTHTVGLDNSVHFIALAQQESLAQVVFHCHDVERVPFPMPPAEVLFCRLLLTHLARPQDTLTRWATQIQSHGRLLIQEVEWIHTNSATFTTYLEMQQTTLARQAHCLYIGPVLDTMPVPDLLQRRMSRVQRVPVASAHVATMFWLNFQTWKHHPTVQTQFAATQLTRLEDDLRQLADATRSEVEIVWGLRELVYERL